MATGREYEHAIAKALNSARGANILDENDLDGVRDLVTDYFATPATHEIDSDDDDVEENDDEMANDENGDAESDESETADMDGVQQNCEEPESDGEFSDEGLVDNSHPDVEVDIQENLQLNNNLELTKVDQFDCRCKMKTAKQNSSSSSLSVTTSKSGCISQFSTDEILARRLNMNEFNEAEKDMILLGVLASTPMNDTEQTCLRPSRQSKRRHQRTTYLIDSKMVCRETFKFMYGISQNKLTALLKHYKEHGVTPRVKKWGGRRYNTNALTADDTERVVQFLRHFAEDHALVLPGRIPGFKRADVRILPSSQSKTGVWRHYRRIAVARGYRAVGKSTFFKLWQQYTPFIVVGRPMTDLCWHCKQNNEKIRRTANLPEEEKMRVLGEQMDHLKNVEKERQHYNDMVARSKATAQEAGITTLSRNTPNSQPLTFHYSFDFAQQVHLPSSPLQPGPIYFLVPRKCGIFGVCAEGLPQQVNFLIDEGMSSSKGSNMVISLLHFFLENYGVGEQNMELHCDNCSGQNKNKFLMWYLAWRVIHGLHDNISVNFMPAGHTKFAPDWCFGLLKRRFKVSEVDCLADLCHVVASSTQRGINRAQLVGTEAGEVKVPVYNWQTYFDGWFRPLKGIKSNHHFLFRKEAPGTVAMKDRLEDAEKAVELAYCADTVRQRLVQLPAPIPPPGLPPARREYLFNSIRPYVRPAVQDRVCPRP